LIDFPRQAERLRNGYRLDQSRIVVLDVADARADRPASIFRPCPLLGRVRKAAFDRIFRGLADHLEFISGQLAQMPTRAYLCQALLLTTASIWALLAVLLIRWRLSWPLPSPTG
jgi:hypothetical protein